MRGVPGSPGVPGGWGSGCARVLDTRGSRILGISNAGGPGYAEHLALMWPELATELLTGSSEQAAGGRAECAAGTVST